LDKKVSKIGQKMSDMSITVIYNATEPNAAKFVED
jgi:hypothetical protein